MAPLQTMSRALVRSAAGSANRILLPTTAVRAVSSTPALRGGASSTFESPFKGEQRTKVPDFSKYMAKGSGSTNALFSYFMVGTLGAISAAGAKSTIQGESPRCFAGAFGTKWRGQLGLVGCDVGQSGGKDIMGRWM